MRSLKPMTLADSICSVGVRQRGGVFGFLEFWAFGGRSWLGPLFNLPLPGSVREKGISFVRKGKTEYLRSRNTA